MSDEKRQTRLLPFRLRRASRGDAGVNGEEDFSADAELTALLRTWDVPTQDAAARGRLLADFRASGGRAPLWRRALSAQVRVPLPIAACLGLVLLGSLYVSGTRAKAPEQRPAVQPDVQTTAVRVVEVPVVQERVVRQVVYVEKKERGGARVVSTPSAVREELARRDDKNERDAGSSQTNETAQSPEAQAFTRVDMNDFQPASEMKFRIVSRGGVNEK